MIELKRHVERIVRPIRASQIRKTRMREELLAHLTQLFDEESARCGHDPQAALAAAVDRFGDAGALRADLQATVPVAERWLFVELAGTKWLCRRPGESMAAHMKRTILWSSAVNVLVWTLLVAFIAAVSRSRPHRANELSLTGFILFAIAYALLFPIIVHGPILICHRIHRELGRMPGLAGSARLWAHLRVAGCTAANMSILSGTMGALMMLLDRAIGFPLMTRLWFVVVLLAWAVFGLIVTGLSVAEVWRHDEWGSLNVDADCEDVTV